MKRLMDLVKPFLSLIFGVLMFLYYLNMLGAEGAALALGIIGLVVGTYYLAVGIMGIVWPGMPDNLKKIFNIISVSAFPGFMFVWFLLNVIQAYEVLTPSLWVISILGMIASLSLCVFYIISRFNKQDIMVRLTSMFGLVFVLCLISWVLFATFGGNQMTWSTTIGEIEVVPLLLYGLYCVLMLNSLKKEAE